MESNATARTPGNVFRLDAASGQQIHDFTTAGLRTNTCYRVPILLGGTVGRVVASGGTLIGWALVRPTR